MRRLRCCSRPAVDAVLRLLELRPDSSSPWSPFHPATTLSVYIWKLNSEGIGDFVAQVADAASAVLIIVVLEFNLSARALSAVLLRRATGSRS